MVASYHLLNYLEAVHEFYYPWIIRLCHHVPFSLHMRNLVLKDHVIFQHALHRIHLIAASKKQMTNELSA